MKGVRSDTPSLSRRGRRRIVAERAGPRADDPSATVIEANRHDELFRPADGDTDPSVVKSAHRVLRIFEYFAEIERPATMTEIARRLNYPTSSTAALLKSLVELGYLDHARQERTYRPTVRVALLGGWIKGQTIPGLTLDDITRELRDATRLTTFVVARNQLYSQYLRVLQGTTPVRYYLEPGARRLLTHSTPGRLFLSLMNDDDARRIVQRINAEEAASCQVRFADIQQALATIRRQGFAYTREMGTPGLSAIAMRLTDSDQTPPLAITVAGPSSMISAEAGTIIATMRGLVERHSPGLLPQVDSAAPPQET
ncbi:helix-turn-helix domain-containing protein [Bradyrhizobium jicamae]|uniref:Helix-turn-helix domain-containing protein n=1 Tax=Bradyrhizobium jicamae TaxID=280332 RepID=A0ABS5FKR8_9BRAD|nr:helix-turn-helix domain-containing protein [Bradyrhizobium jicamae]MBR0797384.1 helix-turn-helix domain-containing protein [Bradyrhizobium jicamae]MBR0936224.1 helix-turn-helix domain-containing protein [Bradyrhizobium jicamae]